jgi:hypothetical protein
MKRAAKTKLTFGPTTNNDLWAGYQNSRRIYDEEDVVEYEPLLEWREANYDIFMTARDGNEGEKLVKFLGFEKLESKQNAYLLTNLKKANRQVQHFLDTLDQVEDPPIPHEKGRTSKAQEHK